MAQLPFKALRVLEAVARCGSFKLAAEELCVTESAISHQIRHLEAWFGSPLFDRTGPRPVLKAHADKLAAAIRHSFDDLNSACQAARLSHGQETLVIAAIPSVAVCWLIPKLSDFHEQYPKLATRMTYAIHGQDIDFSQVDLAFVFAQSPPQRPRTQVYRVWSGASVPVCSPAVRDALNLQELPGSILSAQLLHESDIDAWSDWVSKAGLKPKAQISGTVFEDFNLLRSAALEGHGVALCPLALIENDLSAGRLVQLSDIQVNADYDYYLIRRDTDEHTMTVARDAFMQWLNGVHNFMA